MKHANEHILWFLHQKSFLPTHKPRFLKECPLLMGGEGGTLHLTIVQKTQKKER